MRGALPSYRGVDWPTVVPCTFPGCVMRRCATGAPLPWTCADHDDAAQQHVLEVGADIAEATHRQLTAAAPTAYDEPPRERRYKLRPTPRLDPEWTAESA